MKKSVGIVVAVLIVIAIALGIYFKNGSVSVDDMADDVKDTMDDMMDDADDMDDDMMDDGAFSEYELDVEIVSTDANGNEYAVQTTMYKKGDKSLYVINDMQSPEELPFVPNQNLVVGSTLYTQIEIGGETIWFMASDVAEEQNVMFDLADMQTILDESEEIAEVKEETVEGTDMTCYYLAGGTGKACMVDGLFTYGEDTDPTSGMKSVIRVSNYKDSVDDSVFEVPSEDEVKTMEEFMTLMLAELGEEALIPAE